MAEGKYGWQARNSEFGSEKKMLLGVRKDAFRNSRNNGINSKTDF